MKLQNGDNRDWKCVIFKEHLGGSLTRIFLLSNSDHLMELCLYVDGLAYYFNLYPYQTQMAAFKCSISFKFLYSASCHEKELRVENR